MKRLELQFSCTERVDQMPRRPGGHFCTSCKEKVHDLSQVTAKQAERLIARGACVAGYYDERGDLVLAPEPTPLQRTRRALVVLAPLLAAACSDPQAVTPVPTEAVSAEPARVETDDLEALEPAEAPAPEADVSAAPAASGSTATPRAHVTPPTPSRYHLAGKPAMPRPECNLVPYVKPDGTKGYRKDCD